MNIKHTPGPWKIRAERYRFIRVWADLGGIAHLDTIDGEGMANARLIAAAPELLSCLIAVRDADVDGLAHIDIEAAIAKATGA